MSGPRRIVCLTAETAELVFALGLEDSLVGVTGYAVRPREVRRKPRVAAFSTASLDRIVAARPDIVLGFSDLQAGIAADLIKRGLTVLITNQRTLAETYDAIRLVASTLGEPERGDELAAGLQAGIERLAPPSAARRPRVYFEEWDDPMISGIAWIAELIELCGGRDVFAGRKQGQSAAERIIEPGEVIAADPEVIVASWCGKKARLERIAARPGWNKIAAVQNGRLYEIKAPDILQPGLSLIHGARLLAEMIRDAAGDYARLSGAGSTTGPGSVAK